MLIMIAVLIITLGVMSDSFFTFRNLLNILNQNAPAGDHGFSHDTGDHRRWFRSVCRLDLCHGSCVFGLDWRCMSIPMSV